MKKKDLATSQDKKDWIDFVKKLENIHDKDHNKEKINVNIYTVPKLDLHGYSLIEANKIVKKFIIDSFLSGYKKILVVTGRGRRSKVYDDPYKSEKMSILKHSVPEYVATDKELINKIRSISLADIKSGGEGAFYIYLKNKKNFNE